MKLSRIISLCIISLAVLTDANANRVKKDLVESKEKEIIELLEEKIALIDKLIIEAKIYKKDTDTLIQKNFYNTPSVFVTSGGKRSKDISTHTKKDKEPKPKPTPKTETKSKHINKNFKKKLSLGSPTRMVMSSIDFNSRYLTRDIFSIPMQRKDVADVFFHSNINYVPILDRANKGSVNYSYQDKVDKVLTSAYVERLKPSITKVFKKYIEVIALLGSNDMDKYLDSLKPFGYQSGWAISSRIFLFKFNLENDDTLKKRIYTSSLLLDDTFKKLQAREDIVLTTPSKYYDTKIDKNLRCLQTSTQVKYKGKICINSIDVEQEKFFEYGTFETKEHNFIYQNKHIFESLKRLDEKLKKSADKYIEYLLSKVKEIETIEIYEKNKEKPIDIKGGL